MAVKDSAASGSLPTDDGRRRGRVLSSTFSSGLPYARFGHGRGRWSCSRGLMTFPHRVLPQPLVEESCVLSGW